MTMFISALSSVPSLYNVPSRAPMALAGSKNTGSKSNATRVICQLRTNIVPNTMATTMMFPTMLENRSVNACCAPMTSLFRRLTRAPVCVREKKAMGIRWIWAKTLARRS